MSETKSVLIADVLLVAETYCSGTGESLAFVAKQVFSRGGAMRALLAGERDLGTVALVRAACWFVEHWPEGVSWPREAEWLRNLAIRSIKREAPMAAAQ
ncbi:MAG: hypothetical protein KKB37_11225 [Alphaproteobacteria bacterium]|nr:hypothetical protein [Alphaproteobacteria bacterium]